MSTATPTPIVHVFKEYNIWKYTSTRHYEIETVKNGKSQLSDTINVSKNQDCAQSTPKYWLKVREGNKWGKPCLTGLFRTNESLIFKGDAQRKKNLLLFRFSDDAQTLTVYYYSNYFTKDITTILPNIK